MKTTLDLDDDLLVEAKAVAARRRITLRAMVEHALRRELAPGVEAGRRGDALSGLPRLPRQGTVNPNAELHRRLAEGDVEDAIAWLESVPRGNKRRR